MAKSAAASTEQPIVNELRKLGVKENAILMKMAKRGQLSELKCEMPQCYNPKGRGHFDEITTPRTDWAPSPDHYPILKKDGGKLTADNARLSHIRCNQRDYSWRKRIGPLLADGKSLDQIAEILNNKKVPPIHGTNRWTGAMVRKAYVS